MARPREVHDAVLGGLRDCLPEKTQVSLSSPAVIDLIVNSQLFYFALASQAMEEPDRRQKLVLAIDKGSRGLSEDERKDIEVLRRHGLEQGLTLLCVAATARGLLTSKPPTAAP
nr:hypothetical protein REQ54_04080 [Rhizobium sp. Q54]